MKVERVFAGLSEEADKHEKKYVPLFKRKKWNKMEQASPAVYGPSSASGLLAGARKFFFGRFPLIYERKQASELRKRNIGYCVNRVNAV